MNDSVLQLFPLPIREHVLPGLYLGHSLRQTAVSLGCAFVYSNYVVSLDGRIAIPHTQQPGLTVPKHIANDRDWRLFQELAAQADVIITSGRYLREYVDGRAQEILQTSADPRFADLQTWRRENGLRPQPDLAVISASLDFTIPEPLTQDGRQVNIFTAETADPDRRAGIIRQGGQVFISGQTQVQGELLISQLSALGYQTIYNAAGPKVLHLLLDADVLDRLYLTTAHRILGGDPFATIVDGPLFNPPVDMTLYTLYFDAHAFDEVGQLFAAYQRIRPTP